MIPRHRRLTFVLVSLSLAGIAIALALWALQDTVTYYYSPAKLTAMSAKPTEAIRVGGLVVKGSLRRLDATSVEFRVSDNAADLRVEYSGALPDLFREGQGVIAQGHLEADGAFRASSILAKHDETYMPKEVVKMLKARGDWHGEAGEP